MSPENIARVQAYLRRAFSNERLKIIAPKSRGPVEVHIGDEFIGTLDEDTDEGETSWSMTVTILDIDLPTMSDIAATPGPRRIR